MNKHLIKWKKTADDNPEARKKLCASGFFAVPPLEKCRRGSIMKTCMIIVIVTPEYGYGTGLKTGREI